MYLRVSTVRKGGKTYRYAQIVESYRREDGKPTNRVLVSLGQRSDQEVAAIRAALAVGRKKGSTVLPAKLGAQVKVLHSLRYLDAALLLRTWRDFGLHSLLRETLRRSRAEVTPAEIIAALVLQRCLAPGSKLAASRWFPTTALPELQGVTPRQFNNSRIHRALTDLEEAEERLQEKLPEHIHSRQGEGSVFFLDATDTWFEGGGPPLAARGKDKEGLFRMRVGIVLLCDDRGFPMRWHTLSGRYHDATSLAEMAAEVAQLSWTRHTPVIMDRALGNAGWVQKLDDMGLHYLTCLPKSEIESSAAPIPWQILTDLETHGDSEQLIAASAAAAGFVQDDAGHCLLELGIFEKTRPKASKKKLSQARWSLQVIEELERVPEKNKTLCAQELGLGARTLWHYTPLTSLASAVRERIRSGEADGLNRQHLLKLARMEPKQQDKGLDDCLKNCSTSFFSARSAPEEAQPPLKVRAALSLSPQRKVQDRKTDEEGLAKIRASITSINKRIESKHSHRTDASALAEVQNLIRKHSLGAVCSLCMEKTSGGRQLSLKIHQEAWDRRRRTDGLTLIVSHPEVPGTAIERVAQYFAKDTVEKDFQTIKSVLGLRPVRHRTDPKLRAHVTLCVLALLLTRVIEKQLREAKLRTTTLPALVEQFEPIRLNLIDDGHNRYYTATQPGEGVSEILRALSRLDLVDSVAITKEIVPR